MKTLYNLEDFCFDLPLETRDLALDAPPSAMSGAADSVVTRSAQLCVELWAQRRLLARKSGRTRSWRLANKAR